MELSSGIATLDGIHVIAIDENEKLALKMMSGPMLRSYEQRWTLQRRPSGSTFTFMEELGFPWGPIGKLIGRMMQGSSEAFIDRMLPKLKALAEA